MEILHSSSSFVYRLDSLLSAWPCYFSCLLSLVGSCVDPPRECHVTRMEMQRLFRAHRPLCHHHHDRATTVANTLASSRVLILLLLILLLLLMCFLLLAMMAMTHQMRSFSRCNLTKYRLLLHHPPPPSPSHVEMSVSWEEVWAFGARSTSFPKPAWMRLLFGIHYR